MKKYNEFDTKDNVEDADLFTFWNTALGKVVKTSWSNIKSLLNSKYVKLGSAPGENDISTQNGWDISAIAGGLDSGVFIRKSIAAYNESRTEIYASINKTTYLPYNSAGAIADDRGNAIPGDAGATVVSYSYLEEKDVNDLITYIRLFSKGTDEAANDLDGRLIIGSQRATFKGAEYHRLTAPNVVTNATQHSLMPKSYIDEKAGASGSSTFSGDGTITTFTVAHGAGYTPAQVLVTATSADAAANYYITNKTSTGFDVVFITAPPAGTGNIKLDWVVKK